MMNPMLFGVIHTWRTSGAKHIALHANDNTSPEPPNGMPNLKGSGGGLARYCIMEGFNDEILT